LIYIYNLINIFVIERNKWLFTLKCLSLVNRSKNSKFYMCYYSSYCLILLISYATTLLINVWYIYILDLLLLIVISSLFSMFPQCKRYFTRLRLVFYYDIWFVYLGTFLFWQKNRRNFISFFNRFSWVKIFNSIVLVTLTTYWVWTMTIYRND